LKVTVPPASAPLPKVYHVCTII